MDCLGLWWWGWWFTHRPECGDSDHHDIHRHEYAQHYARPE